MIRDNNAVLQGRRLPGGDEEMRVHAELRVSCIRMRAEAACGSVFLKIKLWSRVFPTPRGGDVCGRRCDEAASTLICCFSLICSC